MDIKEISRKGLQETMVIHHKTSWLGRKALKCPTDAWVYQELIWKLKPDFVIETGTAFGGGATFLASICDLIGHGEVITIELSDARPREQIFHGRVIQLRGSSVDDNIIVQIKEKVVGKECLVILDSDHGYKHVREELEIYHKFVPVGGYIIVEDTHMGATARAARDFLTSHNGFSVDEECEKFVLTFNPDGFLKRDK